MLGLEKRALCLFANAKSAPVTSAGFSCWIQCPAPSMKTGGSPAGQVAERIFLMFSCPPAKNASLSLFECFSYVCPERVLVKCSLLAKMTSQKICVLRTRHGQDHVLCAGNEEGGLCYWRSGELRRRVVVDIHHPVLSDEQILRHAQHRQTAY